MNAPEPIETMLRELDHGDRHPVEDADSVEVHDELDIAVHHRLDGHEVILRYSIWTAWHDGDGPHKEFDYFERDQ